MGANSLTLEVWSDELSRINAASQLQRLRRQAREQMEQQAAARTEQAARKKPDTRKRLFE